MDWFDQFDDTTLVEEPTDRYSSSRRYTKNPIVVMTFEFSLSVMRFADELNDQKRFVIAKQLLRSGTSIGANVREAQNAESKKDFIHKLKIALKEAYGTEYWLLQCQASDGYPKVDGLLEQLIPILKILNKIISSSKKAIGQLP